ncbi:MAG: glycosyltransferase family 2 protein [Desulfobulbaceae bacterium]|jgi:glycosyltransferase involved in cell wall biosynthesis|nr:glycosyltransferase family 2 protein [Desulfobulbaceae bacterium]
MKPVVVIPVYNHPSVAAVIAEARALGLPIIAVDDGSDAETRAVLAALSDIVLLRHGKNQGKGAALLMGFTAAVALGHDAALTIDADGQHRPADGIKLLAVAEKELALVVGARQGMAGEHVPWSSRFGRGFSNFWVWACGGPRVSDSQSGFRLYPLPESLNLGVRARRYQFEVEILVLAKRHGLTVKEAPISVIYQGKGQRVSHFRPWLDFWRNSQTFSRLLWRRLTRRS